MNLSRLTNISLSEIRGIVLVIVGTVALLFYYSWWFQGGRLLSVWFVIGFVFALFYGVAQMLLNWVLYLGTHHRPQTRPQRPKELTVDVFVTACGEDYDLIKRNLLACCAMRGEHTTWLLDDGDDPTMAQLAQELGVGYLTRPGHQHAKAGNLNAALARTKGDVIAIFDIDHIPQPDYLEKTVGYFADSTIGFVQVMPTFANSGGHGFVAQAATETSFDFYNPTSLGMDGFDSVTKMGSNSLIRRTALEEIGGYRPGLAEDLATSIALHAAGWQSRYVAEPLAPGLSPPDLTAWFTQQFKWARGVFEVLLTDYPRLFGHLSWGGRMAYAVRTTKYLIGPVIFIHLAITIVVLAWGNEEMLATLQEYFYYLTPVAVMDIIIRHLALRRWHHSSIVMKSLWRAVTLIYATWPVYTLAWIMAVLRFPVSFRPTPKNQVSGINPLWLLPQLVSIFLLFATGLFSLVVTTGTKSYLWLLYVVTIGLALPQVGVFRPLLRPIFTAKDAKTGVRYNRRFVVLGWERLNLFLQKFIIKEVETIKALSPIIGQYRQFIVGVVGLGLLGAIFEGVGISLFIPLLYSFSETYFEFDSDSWLVLTLNQILDLLPASNRIYIISLFIFILVLLKNMVIYTKELLSSQLYAYIAHQLRSSVFEQLLEVSIGFIDRNEKGKFINALVGETWTTAEAVSNFVEFIILSFTIFVLTSLLFLVSWQLTLFVIAVSIIISILIRLVTHPIENLSRQGLLAEEALSQRIIEVLNGMRIVRLYGREQHENMCFAQISQDIKRIYFKIDRLSNLIYPVSEILATVSIIVVLVISLQNPNQLPLILTFIIILYRLQPLVVAWDETRTAILEAAAPVEDVMNLIKVEDKPRLPSGPIPFTQLQQGIEFKNVAFSYVGSEQSVVKDISIQFPKNKTTAVVGPSGAGKSTLIHLLSRFYDPTNGVIYVDDVPLQELNLASWRQRIAVVSQDVHLFNITIRQNIAYSKMKATEAQIVEAAKKAGIHQFICSLPNGYETKVGDQGVSLSGGQKQRIALARAIIRDPDILILDEATNALDSISETHIQKTIQQFAQNRTVIVIAHRLSTIEDADQIFVISAGQIVEQGSISELLQKDKLFAELHSLQNSNVAATN